MRNKYQMKNGKRTEDTVNNSIVLTLLIFTFSFFFCLSCDNFVEPPEIHTPVEDGYGRISVALTAGEEAAPLMGRTVFPTADFDRYEYTFTKAGEHGVVKVPDADGYFTLEVGNYTVAVKAYTSTAGSEVLAANGVSAEFSVGPDDNEPVAVRLTAVIDEWQGTFIYTITYPAGAEAEITLYQWPDLDEPIELAPANLAQGNGVTETLELEAGFYLLTVLIDKEGQYAGTNETIHIYPAFTTVYTENFDDTHLHHPFTPTADNYTISGTEVPYDGSPKTLSIARREIASSGVLTVFYDGTNNEPINVGVYTVTFDVAAARGWNAATGLSAGTLTIIKAAGAAVNAPTADASSITIDSITVNAVSAHTEQSVEYAINTADIAPSSGWQTETTFNGLDEGTTYYIFARSAANDNYETGAASDSLIVTTKQTVPANRIEYYWVDEHGSLVTTGGGAVTVAVGVTLTITAQDDGYTVWQWHLNGIDTGERENTLSFSNTAAGKYIVGLIVEKDGKFYNTNITIGVGSYYSVIFNANGGSGPVPATEIVTAGSITLPSESGLTRSGYTFGGWNINSNGTGTTYSAGSSYTVNSNVTLYARWTSVVTFDVNGGSGTVPTSQTVAAGSSITLPNGSGLTMSGYAFGGWNTNASGTGTNYSASSYYTPTGNVTLYAKWLVPYTVTFDANGGSGTVPVAQSVAPGSYITLPSGSGLTRTGYAFDGWNTNSSGDGTNYNAGASYMPVGDITLYAKWLRTVTIDMYDSYGDGWNGCALRINVNGTNLSSNATIGSGSTGNYSFNVAYGDSVNIYWVSGSYQDEVSFIMYYADTPPSPAFTASNNNSWNGSNALVYRLRGAMNGISGGTLLGSFTVQ